jgi:hypothetical protein
LVGDCPLRPSVLAQAASVAGTTVDSRTASLAAPHIIPIFQVRSSNGLISGSTSPRGSGKDTSDGTSSDLTSLPGVSQSPLASPAGSRSQSPDPSQTSDDDDDDDDNTTPSTPLAAAAAMNTSSALAADDISDTQSTISVSTTATGSSASSATSGGSGAASAAALLANGNGVMLESKSNRSCPCNTTLPHSSSRLTAAAIAAGAAISKLDLPLSNWSTHLQPLASALFSDLVNIVTTAQQQTITPLATTRQLSGGTNNSGTLSTSTLTTSSSLPSSLLTRSSIGEVTWPSSLAASGMITNGNSGGSSVCYLSFLGYVCHRVREDIWFAQRRTAGQTKAPSNDHDRITSADMCSGIHHILLATRPNIHPDFTHMTTPVTAAAR